MLKVQAHHVEILSEFLQKDINHEFICPYNTDRPFQLCATPCGQCHNFIDLPRFGPCPCGALGTAKAITDTWKAIISYDLGIHKWNEEGGE